MSRRSGRSTGLGLNLFGGRKATADQSGGRRSISPTPSNSGSGSKQSPIDNDMISNNTTNDHGGLSDSEYARKRRELMILARDLSSLGASKELDVPRIVVIGAQSAGKSSLVEAVTGIHVPRDSGTCTRCPMECTILTTASQWSCTISLRIGKVNQGFSPALNSKQDVEIWIRRAQAALLCPHLGKETFKTKTREELKELTDPQLDADVLKFTKDVVVVDITDPEGADLRFVDLPGLISNADEDVIQLVRSLVTEYISSPSTIILVTVPANNDLENQEAMKLAHHADPDGQRTLCVVTKPDTVGTGETGARKMWQDIFDGNKHRLRLGYYCVRLPNDEDRSRNISRQEINQNALRFFAVTAPWKDIKEKHRLGINNLVRDISRLLMRVLMEALPKLKAAVSEMLDVCLSQIGLLPEVLTTDAAVEVVKFATEFCSDVVNEVLGYNEDKSFVHKSREVYRLFKVDIRRTAPDFRPFEHPERFHRPADPPSQREEAGDSSEHCENRDHGDGDGDSDDSHVMGLLHVRKVIKERTGWLLPHSIPYAAKVRLIKEFEERWPASSKKCFGRLKEIVEGMIAKQVSAHFSRFPSLEKRVTQLLRPQLEVYVGRSNTAVEDVLRRERCPYWTQNGQYLEATRDIWLGHYKLVRYREYDYRAEFHPPSMSIEDKDRFESAAINALRYLGYKDITATSFSRLVAPDPFDDELGVMADVRSYFQVAYKRVIDNIPMTIHHELMQKFANSLQQYLLDKLEIGNPDASQRLQELLAEDPEITHKRVNLQNMRKRLETIMARLNDFEV